MAERRRYRDRAEYLIKAVKKRRRKLKEMAVKYKGGKCVFCGYKKTINALEFHHLERGRKDFSLSQRGLTRSWERIKKELDKCLLVCANCHREIHAGKLQLPRESEAEKPGEFREA